MIKYVPTTNIIMMDKLARLRIAWTRELVNNMQNPTQNMWESYREQTFGIRGLHEDNKSYEIVDEDKFTLFLLGLE